MVPNPRNPRRHSDKQIRQLARSIEAFRFNVPVLVDSNLMCSRVTPAYWHASISG